MRVRTPMRRRNLRTEGVTLIEIMVVIVIIALGAVGASYGLGALRRTELRSSALDIVSAVRFAYHRANTRGNTYRIAIDFQAHTIAVEQAVGAVTINMDDEREIDPDDDNAAVNPWTAAQRRLDDAISANIGRATFSAVTDEEGEQVMRFQPHRLPIVTRQVVDADNPVSGTADVFFLSLVTPHEVAERTEGKGYIYFFPGGRAEGAVVQIGDDADHVYSVSIHPLTGRATVYPFAYEAPNYTEEDFQEMRDPR